MKTTPSWMKVKIPRNSLVSMRKFMSNLQLHTVCEEARCPNRGECFQKGTATFMLLGNICTRKCAFCNVAFGKPEPLDQMEPAHVAEAVKQLALQHVVLTSVTRDDLPDGGAAHYVETIKEIKRLSSQVAIEVLIPDFRGSEKALDLLFTAPIDVLNHNLETVPSLYKKICPTSNYQRSLSVLSYAKEKYNAVTKSGLIVGMGETREEVFQVMKDLRQVGCDLLTIGQYLQPGRSQLEVVEFIPPEVYKEYEYQALSLGFSAAFCAPLVRSSYHAKETAASLL